MDVFRVDEGDEILREGDGKDDGDKTTTMDESTSDSEESEDSEDGEEGEMTRSIFRKILDDLKFGAKSGRAMSGTLDLANETDLETFMQQKGMHLAKKSDKDMTLLHLIAEAPKKEMPDMEKMGGLISELVKLRENLLGERDHDGKTPLFSAIMNRNRGLVRVMVEAHPDINSVLRMGKSVTNPQSTNCIHEAIIKKSSINDDKILVHLIKRANPDTLCALDENGFTPLHLAVEYKRCDNAQLQVVQSLVERCEKALDKTYQHPEKGPLSPYLYHELTSEASNQREPNALDTKRKSEKTDPDRIHNRERLGQKDYVKDLKYKDSNGQQPKERSRDQSMQQWSLALPQPGMESTQAEVPAGKSNSEPTSARQGRSISAHAPLNAGSRKLTFTSKEKDKEGPTSKKLHKSKVNATPTSALEIKRFLKLHYLRHRYHDEAARFLYGPKQERQIYFDLFGISSGISIARLIQGLHHLRLEDTLQYVAFPRVLIEDEPAVKSKPGQSPPKPNGSGRTDMKLLFRWLKDDKKVKTILKVIVDDLTEPAHSDETIEACLAGMGVELWDWRKFDLSPEVIQKVAPRVRMVHLYWSGNNAVLRGWSAPDGLKMLKDLERVQLYVRQGLETRDRIKKNVATFKELIETGTPITVEEVKLRESATDFTSKGMVPVRDPYERHKWIESMEGFADFLQAAERNAELSLRQPITVAIIDDGVDINDPNLLSRIQGGSSFCRRDEEQNLNNPYYVSPGGHGTAMARLICKVCPNVRLYILRLDEYYIDQGKRAITAKSAAKAVRAAVEEKVDIISMSWTIEKTDRNELDIRELDEAICSAADHNILMFCAAADQGAAMDKTYPAASATKKIFKIGAAEAAGGTYKWVGDPSLVDFIFPGHQVVTERHDDPRVKNYTPLTGSSVATALASALAAVTLYTVQIGGIWQDVSSRGAGRPKENPANRFKSLKDHDKMREAFLQIGTTESSHNKYIKVWERFSRKVKKADSDNAAKDTYIDYIADLADQLMFQL